MSLPVYCYNKHIRQPGRATTCTCLGLSYNRRNQHILIKIYSILYSKTTRHTSLRPPRRLASSVTRCTLWRVLAGYARWWGGGAKYVRCGVLSPGWQNALSKLNKIS